MPYCNTSACWHPLRAIAAIQCNMDKLGCFPSSKGRPLSINSLPLNAHVNPLPRTMEARCHTSFEKSALHSSAIRVHSSAIFCDIPIADCGESKISRVSAKATGTTPVINAASATFSLASSPSFIRCKSVSAMWRLRAVTSPISLVGVVARTVWLDENRGTLTQTASSRIGAGRLGVHLYGCRLQSGAHPQSYGQYPAAAVCLIPLADAAPLQLWSTITLTLTPVITPGKQSENTSAHFSAAC